MRQHERQTGRLEKRSDFFGSNRVPGISGLSLCLFCLLASGVLCAEVVQTWSFNTPEDLKQVVFYQGDGHSFTHKICDSEKTPDGDNSLQLIMTSSAKDSPHYRKQINMIRISPAGNGEKYRLGFYYKGSIPGQIQLNVSEGVAPYRTLDKKGSAKLQVEAQWRKFSLEFEVNGNFMAPLAVPRLMAGEYPVGGILYIGPVTLERMNPMIPLALSDTWKFIDGQASADRIPANAKEVQLTDNSIDIVPLAGGVKAGEIVTFYNEIHSGREGMMQLGMAADWFFECFVNGDKVFSTMTRGNLSHDFKPEDNIFNVPVKKGINLLCVRVKSGSAGWRFSCGGVAFVGNPIMKVFTPKASAEYRPVNKDKFLEIKAGTALDFSGMISTPVPAGSAGRLIVNAEGNLAFEKNPGVPVRFMAFNWTPGQWRYAAHKWTKDDIDRFADAIVRRGYNMVRFHNADIFFLGYRIHDRPHKTLSEVKIPQTVAEMDLDMGNLDIFDYIVASFKKRGIYINLDLLTSRSGYTLAYPFAGDVKHEESFKTRLFTEQTYRNHWRAAVEYLMNHKNPYTGLKLKDEPTIACVCFVNEQDLRIATGLGFFNEPFKQYLKKKYNDDKGLARAWNRDITMDKAGEINEELLRRNDRSARDAGDFLVGSMLEMSGWFYGELREIGYPGLVTHWDMIMRMMEIPARAQMPVIAQHTYFAHPNPLPMAKLLEKSRANLYVNNLNNDTLVDQSSSIDSSYFRAAAAARFLDRPYMITEYSHSSFNKFRHERGLYFGSYAALQGWDALTAHANTVRLNLDPFLTFESALDPISVASEAVAALAFMRGDVKEAPHSVGLKLSSDKLFPGNYLSSIGDDYAKIALVTKIGLLYPEGTPLSPVGKAHPSLILEPEKFAYLNVSQWYVSADSTGDGESETLFALLREKKILPSDNHSNPEKGIFISETGELALDTRKDTMKVVAPRLEGAVIKKNEPVKLKAMEIVSCSRPASIVAASLDKNTDMKNSRRILLVIATNAFNTGMIFADDAMRICYESGNAPALMQSVKTDIILNSSHVSAPKVYALNMDGTRETEINGNQKNGRLFLSLDTSTLKYGTPYFEIVYEDKK